MSENLKIFLIDKEKKILEELNKLGCTNIDGLDTIPMESARYLTAGMERARELFGDQFITMFTVQKGMSDFGDYSPIPPTIRIGRKKAEDDPIEAYFTAQHESAHHYDHAHSSGTSKATAYDYSSKVIKKALKNLGLNLRSDQARSAIYYIDYKWKSKDGFSEIFAKSIEFGEAGSPNILVNEIRRMILKGEMPV